MRGGAALHYKKADLLLSRKKNSPCAQKRSGNFYKFCAVKKACRKWRLCDCKPYLYDSFKYSATPSLVGFIASSPLCQFIGQTSP